MNYYDIILRLKKSEYKYTEASSIKRLLRELPVEKRTVILGKLEEEKYKSDNSDVIDVINDIINDFKPNR